jgi:hypothetical protein
MAEGSPQTVIEQDEQVDLPPILMLLKANDRNHPLEMQERFIASYRNEAERSRCRRSMAWRSTEWSRRPASRKRCVPSTPSPHSFGGKLVSAFADEETARPAR